MIISPRQLQHVLAVAEHRNFGRAADALHITQPALSRSIQVIEAIVSCWRVRLRPRAMQQCVTVRRVVECDSSSVLKSILMHSDAVSMMPGFMVDAEVRSRHLVALPAIDLGIRTHFGAAWLRNRSMSGPGLKFIELLREHDAALARNVGVTDT